MNTTYFTTCPSPIEDLLLTTDGEHLTGLYMAVRRYPPDDSADSQRADDHPILRETARQLRAYFAGQLRDFDIPLQLTGTDFQKLVWDQLCAIPYGATTSYGELARRINRPNASRAVGLANGRNPISIIVPCHRVIGSTGSLVGYGGGLERKIALLQHERSFSQAGGQYHLTASQP